MSETTADILKKLGGYDLISRGQREVKVSVITLGLYTPRAVSLYLLPTHRARVS